MGYIVTKQGLKPEPSKVKAMKNIPRQTCKKEFKSLLSFVNGTVYKVVLSAKAGAGEAAGVAGQTVASIL